MYYVNARWLGGMLTNFKHHAHPYRPSGPAARRWKRTAPSQCCPRRKSSSIRREIAKLEKYLGGVKDMKKLPGALFIVDPRKERNADC